MRATTIAIVCDACRRPEESSLTFILHPLTHARGILHSRRVALDLSQFDAILLDLDGTVYHEDHPLPGALELIRKLQRENRRFACLSNSASSPLRVMNRLHAMGVEIDPDHIYTAAA